MSTRMDSRLLLAQPETMTISVRVIKAPPYPSAATIFLNHFLAAPLPPSFPRFTANGSQFRPHESTRSFHFHVAPSHRFSIAPRFPCSLNNPKDGVEPPRSFTLPVTM